MKIDLGVLGLTVIALGILLIPSLFIGTIINGTFEFKPEYFVVGIIIGILATK